MKKNFALGLFLASFLLTIGCDDFTPNDVINAYNNSTIQTYGQSAAVRHGLIIGNTYSPPAQPRVVTSAPVRPATGTSNTTRPMGRDASYCVSYSGGGPAGAFFKGSLTNRCSESITVSFCETSQCLTSSNFYNSSTSLRPGGREPVDTVGRGVRFAACFSNAYVRVINRSNGSYECVIFR